LFFNNLCVCTIVYNLQTNPQFPIYLKFNYIKCQFAIILFFETLTIYFVTLKCYDYLSEISFFSFLLKVVFAEYFDIFDYNL